MPANAKQNTIIKLIESPPGYLDLCSFFFSQEGKEKGKREKKERRERVNLLYSSLQRKNTQKELKNKSSYPAVIDNNGRNLCFKNTINPHKLQSLRI